MQQLFASCLKGNEWGEQHLDTFHNWVHLKTVSRIHTGLKRKAVKLKYHKSLGIHKKKLRKI